MSISEPNVQFYSFYSVAAGLLFSISVWVENFTSVREDLFELSFTFLSCITLLIIQNIQKEISVLHFLEHQIHVPPYILVWFLPRSFQSVNIHFENLMRSIKFLTQYRESEKSTIVEKNSIEESFTLILASESWNSKNFFEVVAFKNDSSELSNS